jgi:hypothetical protein
MYVMVLPRLSNLDKTTQGLHKFAQVLGVLRMVRLPHVANYLEMALKIVPEGLSTDVLPSGSEVILNFQKVNLEVHRKGAQNRLISLNSQSQSSLLTALLHELRGNELADLLKDATDEGMLDDFLAAAAAAGHDLSSPHNKITGNEPLAIDPQLSCDYGQALYAMYTGVSRFSAHLNGPQTPVVVWPGHFDLSFLWFATERAEESAPHMNFGFAPYGGGIDEPYLYAYAYPMPPENTAGQLPALPFPAYWHTTGWTGVVLQYSAIAAAATPEYYVETMCEGIFKSLRPLLG